MTKAEIIRRGSVARPGLRADAQLLRSAAARVCPAADATAACFARAGFEEAGVRDPLRRRMSSERLYYTDAYLIEFDAVVRDVGPGGSSGRSCWIGPRFIRRREASRSTPAPSIRPRCSTYSIKRTAPSPISSIASSRRTRACAATSTGTRRFDHMQQHTGQHLLSAAFEREAGARTVSFHLGTAASTIDLDKELSADVIARVEDAANRVLWEDREVCVKFVTAAEAAKLPLRKDPARTGELRIVEINDYDMSACGGTHVRQDRRDRADRDFELSSDSRADSGSSSSAARARFARSAGSRPRSTARCGCFRCCRRSFLPRLRNYKPPDGASRKLRKVCRSGWRCTKRQDLRQALKALAGRRSSRPSCRAGMRPASRNWRRPSSPHRRRSLFCSPAIHQRSPSSRARHDLTLDTGVVLKKLIERFGGKGGGKGAMAQGGGLSAAPQEILTTRHARKFGSPVHRPCNKALGVCERNPAADAVRHEVERMFGPRQLQQY